MVQGYIIDEALGFCTKYMQGCLLTQWRVWDNTEDPAMNGEVLEGNGRHRALTAELRERIHEFVINNAEPLQLYREYVSTCT
jgi:hypothetical protein